MTKMDLERLKERILERYDPDYLVDVLKLTSQDILDAFEDRLEGVDFSELEDEELEE